MGLPGRSLCVGLAIALAWIISPSIAEACSCDFERVEAFLPRDGTHLPANARGITFFSSYRRTIFKCEPPGCYPRNNDGGGGTPLPAAAEFSVEIVTESGNESVPFVVEPQMRSNPGISGYKYANELLIAPVGAMRPGATYRFVGPGTAVNVIVDAEPLRSDARLPLRVDASRRTRLSLAGGSMCSERVDAGTRSVSLVLPSKDWAGALWFTTLVDGEPWTFRHVDCDFIWPHRSWIGAAQDILFQVCSESPHLRRPVGFPFVKDSRYRGRHGRHTVQMVAQLPGTNVRLESQVVTFSISCAGPPAPSAPKVSKPRPKQDAPSGASSTSGASGRRRVAVCDPLAPEDLNPRPKLDAPSDASSRSGASGSGGVDASVPLAPEVLNPPPKPDAPSDASSRSGACGSCGVGAGEDASWGAALGLILAVSRLLRRSTP